MFDESVFELMLQDPGLEDLYGSDADREEIRGLLFRQEEETAPELPKAGFLVSGGEGGRIYLEVEPDGLAAWITLGEPKEKEGRITEADIRVELERCGIMQGIDTSCVIRLSKNPVYGRSFIIARGCAAKHGAGSFVKYYFDTDPEPAPLETDGTVDFKEINFVQLVKKGDLLCELVSGRPGRDGYTVTGEVIEASGCDGCKLPHGKNTRVSPDGGKLYAACDGEVTMKHGTVHVDRVLYLDHVDSGTGNIRFIGSVYIRGRICEGFTVKATENIKVGEVIEDAKVSAGGCIKVVGGVKGGPRGFLSAGDGIAAPFIENMKVEAGGNILTNVVINSEIDCKGRVSVLGEKGCILGGLCRAREIDAASVGNEANLSTTLEISGTDEIDSQIDNLISDLSIHERIVARLQAGFRDKDNQNRIEVQKELLSAIYKKNEIAKRIKQLEESIVHLKKTYGFDIKIRRELFDNVTIKIDGITYKNTERRGGSVFFRADNKVVIRTYR